MRPCGVASPTSSQPNGPLQPGGTRSPVSAPEFDSVRPGRRPDRGEYQGVEEGGRDQG